MDIRGCCITGFEGETRVTGIVSAVFDSARLLQSILGVRVLHVRLTISRESLE